jgi:hypothetical protein
VALKRSFLAKEKGDFIAGLRCSTVATVVVGASIRSSSFVEAAKTAENCSDCNKSGMGFDGGYPA